MSVAGSSVSPPALPDAAMLVELSITGVRPAPCFICGWWDYFSWVVAPFARPFCHHCLGELMDGRLRHCPRCGWWDWDRHDDNPVCEHCLSALARRTRLALPALPVCVCARIVYWELYIDDPPRYVDVTPLWLSSSTDDLADQEHE